MKRLAQKVATRRILFAEVLGIRRSSRSATSVTTLLNAPKPRAPAVLQGQMLAMDKMYKVDRSIFDEDVPLKVVEFSDSRRIQALRQHFEGSLFSRSDLKSYPAFVKPEGGKFRFLLAESIKGPDDLTETQRAALRDNDALLIDGVANVTFDSLTQEAILRRLLPDVGEITTRFEQVGHIAHVNLQPHLLPHKYVIGAVLLEKNAALGVRTVVNKTNFIENQFRVLPMEIIAGPDETMVELEENGSKFRFDFREVFWNSRLLNEHRRIVLMCSPGDVVWDMCAGVGPFAVPLARRGCTVHANDLNPACFNYLNQNADLNLGKRKRPNLKTYNMDGRDFIRRLVHDMEALPNPELHRRAHHVLINLPASAPEFLDVFVGLFAPDWELPRVHCYCFAQGEENSEAVRAAALAKIGAALKVDPGFLEEPAWELEVLKVRQTATATTEFCVSFKLHPKICCKDS
eukprot:TRINITY_DN285_c0_g2_i4.p1 TRINITY_DN285_c0_g2~~TRINITY_DN285_c0_g2_i4.p1  ORF type:complete len:460 (-),score=49.32 TRINITY_DN285_c0_g2_i4:42-1421(-)